MTSTTYFITSNGDSHWRPTTAKTLTAAKSAASRMYQQSVGGKIRVGVCDDECLVFVTVAVKRGYGKWQSAGA